MTGTEKIKSKILEDANARARSIDEQARQEARGIMESASEAAGQKKAELLVKAESDGAELYRRMMAVAGLDGRKELLKAKQEMVDKAFQLAMGKITSLSDREYQKLIEELVVDAAVEGDGEILLSEKDLHRMDSQLLGNIKNGLVSAGTSGNLTLSREKISTAGGFILRYGDMEINSTFEILFGMLRPQLENEVVKLLFGT